MLNIEYLCYILSAFAPIIFEIVQTKTKSRAMDLIFPAQPGIFLSARALMPVYNCLKYFTFSRTCIIDAGSGVQLCGQNVDTNYDCYVA